VLTSAAAVGLLVLLLCAVPWVVNPSGTAAVSLTRTAAAAGSGTFGLSVAAGGAEAIVLSGPALNLAAGAHSIPALIRMQKGCRQPDSCVVGAGPCSAHRRAKFRQAVQ
jgi:hypothetical protein